MRSIEPEFTGLETRATVLISQRRSAQISGYEKTDLFSALWNVLRALCGEKIGPSSAVYSSAYRQPSALLT